MRSKQKGTLWIGTSGIVVPGSKENFPPDYFDKSRLAYYASFFNSVEINSTFRKIPQAKTFKKWCDEVPEDFQFTFKLIETVTHVKQLKADLNQIDLFLEAAASTRKKGCLLIQFPGKVTSDFGEEVDEILETVQLIDDLSEWRIAVEFRSPTWYTPKTLRSLQLHKASMVLHDMPKSYNLQLEQPNNFYYLRYHGPTGTYRGSYTSEFLKEQSHKIATLINKGSDVYVYFNITMGSAFVNSLYLKASVVVQLSEVYTDVQECDSTAARL